MTDAKPSILDRMKARQEMPIPQPKPVKEVKPVAEQPKKEKTPKQPKAKPVPTFEGDSAKLQQERMVAIAAIRTLDDESGSPVEDWIATFEKAHKVMARYRSMRESFDARWNSDGSAKTPAKEGQSG